MTTSIHFFSRLIVLLGTLILTMWPGVIQAQDDPHDHLLWKISGNGLTQPSYLYGTIHIIGTKDFLMSDATQAAFAASEQLALELDMDDPSMAMAMMQGGMMKDNKTLADLVSEEEYTLVRQFLIDSAGLPENALGMMERMQPMLLASVFYPHMLDGQMKSYEQEFVSMAQQDSIEVLGLETVQTQLSMVEQIPYDEQAEMVVSFATDYETEKKRIEDLIATYVAQDLDGLYELVAQSEDMVEYQEFMLDERNRKWIETMSTLAKEKPTFFAVGAGHLWGEQGVIALLRKAGYTVEPVQ